MWHSWLSIGNRLEQPSQHSPGLTESQLPKPTWSEPSVSASAPFRYAVEHRRSLIGWHFVSVVKDNRINDYYYFLCTTYKWARRDTYKRAHGRVWCLAPCGGSHSHHHTYPGQWCLRRLPEEDLCRAGTRSVPRRKVTRWTKTPAVRCQRSWPAETGCPSELWGHAVDGDSEDTENRDAHAKHRGEKKQEGMKEGRGDARNEGEGSKGGRVGMVGGERCPFVGFLINWAKEKWV